MAGPTRDGPDGPLGDDDVDARWAEITEHLADLRGSQGPGPHPSGEPPRATPPAEDAGTAPTTEGTADPPGPRDYAVEEDEDDGFVAPDPPPPPLTDPVVTLGWATALGAAVALVVLPLVWRPLPGAVLTLVLAALVAGSALLVWRMPRSRDGDRGGGGAVV